MSVPARVVGRYVIHDELAAGGMASVHIGRLQGPVGFSRTVAIKRLHAQYAKDPEFVAMFLDEARLAARIQHPNVVSTLDVIALGGELFLVMDYVHGETLSRLTRALRERGMRLPPHIALAIVADALYGLHAAHEATSERGEPLAIVHRDVSPQNIIVGRDGISRVLDFGVAKAASRIQTTRDGQVKGKLGYMAPEQLKRHAIDRRTDVFSASTVLWEALTGTRLFAADDEGGTITRLLLDPIAAPSSVVPELPIALDAILLRGLAREPTERFPTALEMAKALEAALPIARPAEVSAYVEDVAGDALGERARRIAEIEGTPVGADQVAHVHAVAGEADEASRTMRLSTEPSTSASSVVSVGASRRVRFLLAVTAALAVVVVGGGAWLATRPAKANATAASGASAVMTASSIVPSATAIAAPVPAAAESATSARPLAEPAHAKPATRVKPTHAACEPPFYFDGEGVKRFKPECI